MCEKAIPIPSSESDSDQVVERSVAVEEVMRVLGCKMRSEIEDVMSFWPAVYRLSSIGFYGRCAGHPYGASILVF